MKRTYSRNGGTVVNTTASVKEEPTTDAVEIEAEASGNAAYDDMSKEQLIALVQAQTEANAKLMEEMQRAQAASDNAAMITSNIREVYSHSDEVEDGKNDDGTPKLKSVEYWKYTLDLPPSAGEGLKYNGMPLYHGQTICVDIDTLRMVKDMVYRAHMHEASIFGKMNDNAFRQGYLGNGSRVGQVLGSGPVPAWAQRV